MRRRLGVLLRFPAGIALVTWRYVWRVTALHRSETQGDPSDLPPPLPPELVDEDSKLLADGAGPMFHRRFSVCIEGSPMAPDSLMAAVATDVNRAAPAAAVFHKTRGAPGAARVGDEYRVQMPGPWDGPVRVVHRDAHSLRLATLRGHLEAGQIEFSTAAGDGTGVGDGTAGSDDTTSSDGTLTFAIQVWSRGGDRLADLLYSRLRIAKEIQFNMWVYFCLRTAGFSGGRPRGGVTVVTRALSEDLCAAARGC